MTTYTTGENTKQKMINAAGTLAAEVGFANISTRAVADASGENIGSIHYHFGGKDGLFEAVVRDAIDGCKNKQSLEEVKKLNEASTQEELSKFVRLAIACEINDLFRSDRPAWHSQVIYQLLQRDDALYEMLRTEVMDPGMSAMALFFKIVDPSISEDEAFLRMVIMKMPIFAHANYMKAFLKQMGAKTYSEEYLQKMEDLLVRQTQLSLNLPED
jgi:AcrR family transcriptional regulator